MRASSLLLLLFLGAAPAGGVAAAEDLPADELRARWHSRLAGRHFTARLRLELRLCGLEETRSLTVYRSDAAPGGERVLVRFDAPPDLRDVRLLYREVAGRSNEYFLYTPATRRVRRLPPTLAAEDLYGVDLEFLGFGTSEMQPAEITGFARERLGDREVYRLTERALSPNERFDERTTWIDPATYVPLRTELWLRGARVLAAHTAELREVQGVPTPVEMSFASPGAGREVRLRVESVDYETRLGDDVFAILNLSRRRRELAER